MIVIVDKATGALQMAYFGDTPKQEDYGFPYCNPDICLHLAVPDGMDPHVVKAVRAPDGSWRLEVDAEKEREKNRLVWASARSKRDQLLAQTDYALLSDVSIAPDKLEAVKAYRQALRDLPASGSTPEDAEWPKSPL